MTATQRRKIGETRERICWVRKGFYQLDMKHNDASGPAVLIDVDEDNTVLIRIEVLTYASPAPNLGIPGRNPGWQLKGWREPTDEELAEAAAKSEEARQKRQQKRQQQQDDENARMRRDNELAVMRHRLRSAQIHVQTHVHWWQRLWSWCCKPLRLHRAELIPPARLLDDSQLEKKR